MKDARLKKLAALTRGAAVLGLGTATLGACSKSEPQQAQTVNAPVQPSSAQTLDVPPRGTEGVGDPTGTKVAATDPEVAPTATDGGIVRRHFPVPNALPPQFWADAGADGVDDKPAGKKTR